MINYSICARQNPQNEERDIKYYANAQSVNNLDMAAFAKHIQTVLNESITLNPQLL